MPNLGYTYPKILSAVYLIFKLDWASCIFLCLIWQPYPEVGEWTSLSSVWSLLSLCWPPALSLAQPQLIFPSSCLYLKTWHSLQAVRSQPCSLLLALISRLPLCLLVHFESLLDELAPCQPLGNLLGAISGTSYFNTPPTISI